MATGSMNRDKEESPKQDLTEDEKELLRAFVESKSWKFSEGTWRIQDGKLVHVELTKKLRIGKEH
jgi:hypothetical protein